MNDCSKRSPTIRCILDVRALDDSAICGHESGTDGEFAIPVVCMLLGCQSNKPQDHFQLGLLRDLPSNAALMRDSRCSIDKVHMRADISEVGQMVEDGSRVLSE